MLAAWNRELAFEPTGGARVRATDFAPRHGVCSSRSSAAGCGGVRLVSARTGEVKRLFVRATCRGQGVGRTLLCALEERALRIGCTELALDTDGGSLSALALFRSSGYEPIGDYNGNPYARYWLSKRVARTRVERSD
jgi:GNAT superfamily N-acetyltransferase